MYLLPRRESTGALAGDLATGSRAGRTAVERREVSSRGGAYASQALVQQAAATSLMAASAVSDAVPPVRVAVQQHGPLGDALRYNAGFSPFPVGDAVSLTSIRLMVPAHVAIDAEQIAVAEVAICGAKSTCPYLRWQGPHIWCPNDPRLHPDWHCQDQGCFEVQVTARGMAPAGPRREGLDLRDLPRDAGADRIRAVWGAGSTPPIAGASDS